ncbi:MAG: hypothetical protein SF339_14525 [Blastocatellia bacterium]|nr:hypothetical protein [Blastocatellia bacterium]
MKMTEFVIKLTDDSKAGLLLATLKRLATSQGVEFAVERNGEEIALDATADDARFEALVNQIIADAMAGNLAPLTEEEQRQNAAYWEKVGAEMSLSDDDIVRLVKEQRAARHAHTTV